MKRFVYLLCSILFSMACLHVIADESRSMRLMSNGEVKASYIVSDIDSIIFVRTTVYHLIFDANGGEGEMSAQTLEAGVSQALAANTFTRDGYVFTGWNTKADGSGTSYTDKQSITLSQDITLYAQWKKNIVNYTVTFNANGGTGTMAAQTFEADVSQALAANTFTRDGYVFTGWNTAAYGSGTAYTDGQVITLTHDIKLYAQWKSAGGSGGGSSTSGTENGHDYVDLGLPSGLKWATCNVGATYPEGYGDYFAWGETSPKSNYTWETYKYCNGSETSLTKYNTSSDYGTVDNKTTLDLSDDAARVNWGGNWRMPTKAEMKELINNCTWTWTRQNGVKGYKVTSKTNGNSVFLPAAGYRDGTSVCSVGSFGYYWSSSLLESNPYSAYSLGFDSGYVDWRNYDRVSGHTVRAVCP